MTNYCHTIDERVNHRGFAFEVTTVLQREYAAGHRHPFLVHLRSHMDSQVRSTKSGHLFKQGGEVVITFAHL